MGAIHKVRALRIATVWTTIPVRVLYRENCNFYMGYTRCDHERMYSMGTPCLKTPEI